MQLIRELKPHQDNQCIEFFKQRNSYVKVLSIVPNTYLTPSSKLYITEPLRLISFPINNVTRETKKVFLKLTLSE